ncbi:hypothetical protein BSL78_28701 [Apostichopus japonicus]|uniref:Uncharacterized protein n=1 Tax=Stichopus japonicus TaxID=307972 RepID=A0A2G8JFG2_STIJA|nr:hypothetical protein BSL78_28701 [Apostichopus japonicus]
MVMLLFSKMNIWVTSRKLDHDMKVTNTPYTRVDVVGFTELQRNLYFERFRQLKNGNNDEKEKDIQTTIDSLEIHGDFPIVQLSNFPAIYKQLVFYGVKLAEKEQFKAVIRTFQQMKIKIEFHNSKVPERLSEDELQDIGYFEGMYSVHEAITLVIYVTFVS